MTVSTKEYQLQMKDIRRGDKACANCIYFEKFQVNKKVKLAKTTIQENPNSTVKLEIEITREFHQEIQQKDGSVKSSIFKGRQLECEHFIRASEPGFSDQTNENLNEFETLHIRREID